MAAEKIRRGPVHKGILCEVLHQPLHIPIIPVVIQHPTPIRLRLEDHPIPVAGDFAAFYALKPTDLPASAPAAAFFDGVGQGPLKLCNRNIGRSEIRRVHVRDVVNEEPLPGCAEAHDLIEDGGRTGGGKVGDEHRR